MKNIHDLSSLSLKNDWIGLMIVGLKAKLINWLMAAYPDSKISDEMTEVPSKKPIVISRRQWKHPANDGKSNDV